MVITTKTTIKKPDSENLQMHLEEQLVNEVNKDKGKYTVVPLGCHGIMDATFSILDGKRRTCHLAKVSSLVEA